MKILLAVDGSESSMAAVDEAARMAWPQGSQLKVLAVAEMPSAVMIGPTPMPGAYLTEWEKALEDQAVANTAKALSGFYEKSAGSVDVTAKSVKGDPKEAVLEEAKSWDADLIMIGTHGYNAFERFWLGSVSRTVTSHAKCSVHIVRGDKKGVASQAPMKLLLAVDGSDCGNLAVREIAERPWPAGSEVRVISVIQLPFVPSPETWSLPDSYYSQVEKRSREQAQAAIDGAIAQLRESNAGRETPLTISGEAIVGRVEDVVIKTAADWNADLILLGSHGYRGFQRFLLGSVSNAVASHAACSVQIVRAKHYQ
jgi:nucleotide-binding universal stress UspA family protein